MLRKITKVTGGGLSKNAKTTYRGYLICIYEPVLPGKREFNRTENEFKGSDIP